MSVVDRTGSASRPDASMSLLNDLLGHAADDEYAHAARRAGPGPRRRVPLLLALGLAMAGLLLAVAALQVRARAPEVAETRRSLVAEVEERTAVTDRLQHEVARLRSQLDAASQARLRASAAGSAATTRLRRLALATGSVPASGPGVRVVVDDAEAGSSAAQPGETTYSVEEGRVLDYDLQRLVNGLWAAGAEAVAVDGQRLTALSAIRAAGDAILVDYRPLRPPYTVTALGDSAGLELAFVEEPVGRYFRTLEEAYGIRFDVRAVAQARLPGASATALRYADVAGDGSSEAPR